MNAAVGVSARLVPILTALLLPAVALPLEVPKAPVEAPSGGAVVLAPWRDGLDAVPLPDLRHLDPAVAGQLQAVYDDVGSTLARAGLAEAEAMEAYGLLGKLFHAYELFDVAELCHRNASRLAPADYRWPHYLADVARRRGDLEGARRQHEAALVLRPRDVPSLVGRGEACLGLNLAEPAERSFRAALSIDPSVASAHAGIAQLALSQRRFAEAVEHFEKALALVPDANRLHYGLAMARRGLGQADEARAQLALSGPVGVRTKDPAIDGLEELLRGERVHLVRGRLAYANGRFAEAAAELQAAVEADPRSVRALINLGAALLQVGDADGALARLRQAVALDPANATGQFNLGTLLASRGLHEEAALRLLAAVDANPRDIQARLALARELRATGRPESAIPHLAEAAKLDPRNEEPVLEGASVLVDLRRYAEAISVLEAGHRRVPEAGRTMNVLAYLLAASPDPALRDGPRALDLASRVYAVAPEPAHGRTLAAALAELGRCAEAVRVVSRALDGAAAAAMADAARAALGREQELYRSGPPCRPPVHTRP